MLRFIFPAIICIALCCPLAANAQECCGGAAAAPAMDYSVIESPTMAAPTMAAPTMAAPAMEAPMMAAPMMQAPVMAASSDCGCAAPAPAAPCCQKQRTRKKIERVCVNKQVSKLKRVCTTDACGCKKTKFVRSCETVRVSKLQLVDVPVDPCKQRGGRLKGMFQRLKSSNDCGCAPAPAPCGCN
jgi:hypothetical protein